MERGKELKSCPFCGKEALEQHDYLGTGEKLENIRIGCDTLCCRGNIAFSNWSIPFNARTLWNIRPTELKALDREEVDLVLNKVGFYHTANSDEIVISR